MTNTPPFHISAEPIALVLDFWDVPIEGIAVTGGVAFYFRALFDTDRDDYSGVYEITEVSSATRRLAEAALEWRQFRNNRNDDTRVAWEGQLRTLLDAIATDLASHVTQHVTPKFIRVNNSNNFEDAFTVIWNPE